MLELTWIINIDNKTIAYVISWNVFYFWADLALIISLLHDINKIIEIICLGKSSKSPAGDNNFLVLSKKRMYVLGIWYSMLFLDRKIRHVHVQRNAQSNSTNDIRIIILKTSYLWNIFIKFIFIKLQDFISKFVSKLIYTVYINF